MRNFWSKLVIACAFTVAVAGAQPAPPNAAGVTFGHLHVRTRMVPEHMNFWRDLLGGKASMLGKMQRITLLMTLTSRSIVHACLRRLSPMIIGPDSCFSVFF